MSSSILFGGIHCPPPQAPKTAQERGWEDEKLKNPEAEVPDVPDERPPNSNPLDGTKPWGHARFLYVAKEFTGLFVNHCHILGHEDRGMMQNTQSACADGNWGVTGPVAVGAKCDDQGFCPSDCASGQAIPAADKCPAPPAQMSDWPAAYGYSNPE